MKNVNRPIRHRLAAVAAGGALAVASALAAPAVAHADPTYVDINSICSGSTTCVDFTYTELSGYGFDGPSQDVGDDFAACNGQVGAVSATYTKSIGHTWSFNASIGGSIDSSFLKGAKATAGLGVSGSVTETTSNSTGAAGTVAAGNIGHMLFTPKMWHSEGDMNYVVNNPDGINQNYFDSYIVTDTPMQQTNGQASGTYSVAQHPMSPDEQHIYCGQ